MDHHLERRWVLLVKSSGRHIFSTPSSSKYQGVVYFNRTHVIWGPCEDAWFHTWSHSIAWETGCQKEQAPSAGQQPYVDSDCPPLCRLWRMLLWSTSMECLRAQWDPAHPFSEWWFCIVVWPTDLASGGILLGKVPLSKSLLFLSPRFPSCKGEGSLWLLPA
jgi:hypothetical protein